MHIAFPTAFRQESEAELFGGGDIMEGVGVESDIAYGGICAVRNDSEAGGV